MPPSERIILPSKELKERQPLRGRRIFITGGMTGLGLVTAQEVYDLGADLVLSTHTPEHIKNIEDRFDPKRVSTLTMDLTVPQQIEEAAKVLEGSTDIIHSAAEGMGPAKKTIASTLIKLQRTPRDSQEYQELLEKMEKRIDEVMPYSMAINHEGPTLLLEKAQKVLPPDGWFIYYSSLPSSVNPDWAIFYKGVAYSKHAFEQELINRAPDLVAQANYPAIISGNVLIDSAVGQMINQLVLPLVPEEKRAEMAATFVTYADMTRVTIDLLETDPREFSMDEFPLRRFVVAPHEVTSVLTPDHPSFPYKIAA